VKEQEDKIEDMNGKLVEKEVSELEQGQIQRMLEVVSLEDEAEEVAWTMT